MFTLVGKNGVQFTITAQEAANLLNLHLDAKVTARRENGFVIQDHDQERGFTLVAPWPNGLDMIFQAGGPSL